MRYNYYSHIHRFMRSKLFEFEKKVAVTDFRDKKSREEIQVLFEALSSLLDRHAEHENKHHTQMLINKQSSLCRELESEHHKLDEEFEEIRKILTKLMNEESTELQVALGYEFYVSYTLFVADYLKHLYREEMEIMPELQKYYTDDALRQLTFSTYRDPEMTLEAMQGMLNALFPYINAQERQIFLKDINEACPDKFPDIWKTIMPSLSSDEKGELAEIFAI